MVTDSALSWSKTKAGLSKTGFLHEYGRKKLFKLQFA